MATVYQGRPTGIMVHVYHIYMYNPYFKIPSFFFFFFFFLWGCGVRVGGGVAWGSGMEGEGRNCLIFSYFSMKIYVMGTH